MNTKLCKKCQIEKNIDDFNKNKGFKDGLHRICRDCQKKEKKKYRIKNRDKILEKAKQYYKDNKEEIGERNRKYREKNKEKIKEKDRKYREKNKEKIKIKQKQYLEKNREKRKQYYLNNKECHNKRYKEYRIQYYLNNKEKIKENVKNYAKENPDKVKIPAIKRRAMKKQIKENYTVDDVKYTKELFGYRCFRCGDTKDLCIDHHYPLSKGNPLTRQNAVLLCKSCNCSKSYKLPEEFYDEAMLDELEHTLGIK